MKQPSEASNKRMAEMSFASVYPHYVTKVLKKGRSEDELMEIIEWLTGFIPSDLERLIKEKASFKSFFEQAKLHPNANQIKGVICGYRVEEIENELSRKVRYLDKIVDELAKGKSIEKIKR